MKKFYTLENGFDYVAESCVDGILINPELPKAFDNTWNDARTHKEWRLWWDLPFILIHTPDDLYGHPEDAANDQSDLGWLEVWPTGTRYDVRCLDGEAWDRPTHWGSFPTLDAAVECAKSGPSWRFWILTGTGKHRKQSGTADAANTGRA